MTLFAELGVLALWLMYLWLASAIVASYLSGRKGYGERIGLAFGLLLAVIGVVVWLIWPARPNSDWKVIGVWGKPKVEIPKDTPGGDGPPQGGQAQSAS
jgi:hypothetical protein